MKEIAIIILTLFSFSAEIKYEVQEYSCEANEIRIQYEGTWYSVSLFNVNVNEDSDICSYIEGNLKVELDPLIKIENPLNAYVFIDEKLLQQTLIDHKEASIKISNPKYKYQLSQKSEKVLKEIDDKQKTNQESTNKKIAFILISIWVLLCISLIILKVKKRNRTIS